MTIDDLERRLCILEARSRLYESTLQKLGLITVDLIALVKELGDAIGEPTATETYARNSQRLDTIGSGQAIESRSSRVRGGGS